VNFPLGPGVAVFYAGDQGRHWMGDTKETADSVAGFKVAKGALVGTL